MSESELARMRVTIHDVETNFASVHKRSQPGIYPGAGPRRLFDLEMEALRDHPQCSLLWAAASGSNQSVPRAAFLDAGGFHKDITINEHRELALRLTNAGLRMVPANGAYSYHLTHRSGWRDPSTDEAWEKIFYAAHPIAAVPLLSVFWGSLSDPVPFPAFPLLSFFFFFLSFSFPFPAVALFFSLPLLPAIAPTPTPAPGGPRPL